MFLRSDDRKFPWISTEEICPPFASIYQNTNTHRLRDHYMMSSQSVPSTVAAPIGGCWPLVYAMMDLDIKAAELQRKIYYFRWIREFRWAFFSYFLIKMHFPFSDWCLLCVIAYPSEIHPRCIQEEWTRETRYVVVLNYSIYKYLETFSSWSVFVGFVDNMAADALPPQA